MISPQLRASTSLRVSVREAILKRIQDGMYLPGQPIPSTAVLSRGFGVSPITIKRALRDLQAIGAATTVAGKGTFVKKHRRFLLELNAGIAWDKATIRLISISREKIFDPAMRIFNPPGEPMLCVRRMISFADELPFVFDSSYLSSDLNGDIIDELGESSIAEALSRHAIPVRNVTEVIDASPAAEQAAEVFAIPNGYPMLRRLYRITTAQRDVPIFGILQNPFDRVSYYLNIQSDSKLPRR